MRFCRAKKDPDRIFGMENKKSQINFFPDTFVIYIVIIFAPLVNKNAPHGKNMQKLMTGKFR